MKALQPTEKETPTDRAALEMMATAGPKNTEMGAKNKFQNIGKCRNSHSDGQKPPPAQNIKQLFQNKIMLKYQKKRPDMSEGHVQTSAHNPGRAYDQTPVSRSVQ